jgi:Skp family chaperone for outer membrane proteins
MRRASTLALALGLACGGGATLLARGAGAQDATASLRVAVVDVFACLNAAPRKSGIEQKRRDGRNAVETYVQEQRNKIRDLAGEIERLPQVDPRRRQLQEEFARAQSLLEFEAKWRASQADAAYSEDLESLYAEVKAVIRDVAQQSGYSLVLFKSDDQLNLDRSGEFVLSVAMRPVLYADRGTDITDMVKAKFAASKPPVPPSVPPPSPAAPAPGAVPVPGPR